MKTQILPVESTREHSQDTDVSRGNEVKGANEDSVSNGGSDRECNQSVSEESSPGSPRPTKRRQKKQSKAKSESPRVQKRQRFQQSPCKKGRKRK